LRGTVAIGDGERRARRDDLPRASVEDASEEGCHVFYPTILGAKCRALVFEISYKAASKVHATERTSGLS